MGVEPTLGHRVKPNRLTREDTALLVVDMQTRLLPAIEGQEAVISNACLLLRAAAALNLPVFLTTQYAKGLGPVHPEIASLAGEVMPHDKLTFSCFGSEDLRQALSHSGRKRLLVCGVEAHICVLLTALDAIDAGYGVHVVGDATGSRKPETARIGHRQMEQAGVVITSTETAVYELLGASGTPEFKSLLPHFR